jgi:hypothetical protein
MHLVRKKVVKVSLRRSALVIFFVCSSVKTFSFKVGGKFKVFLSDKTLISINYEKQKAIFARVLNC